MITVNSIVLAAHVVAAVIWVGGMFFSLIVLRPTLMTLEPAPRLNTWSGVFKRFFPWVWMAMVVLLISGYWMVFKVFGGFAGSPIYVHVMQLLGLLMIALFIYLYYVIYPLFKNHVQAGSWPEAAAAVNRIRHVMLVNLVLGLVVVAIASGGRYW